ncbi:acyl-CoA dehydrogenase family protein [Ferrovibrio sp.]|uniref:acyl-CoA dehydrogenase family protein n=1 Tax=Ferrovibrio sp. TaxID=1917215 RepID=UPI003D2DA184
MTVDLTADQQSIRDAVARLCTKFGDDYWLARDRDGEFPEEFKQALAEGGWLGLTMPVDCGGAGFGITEGAIMMQAIAESGAGMSGASAIHLNVFAPKIIARYGTEEQKQRMLPPIISGQVIAAFGVTEPDAGLDTTNIKTKAVLKGDRYIVNGRKVWTTLAQRASKLFLLARTTPREQCAKATDGISLFYTDLDRTRCEAREIEKMGRKCIDSNQFFIDNLEIPVHDRIGEEGRGFEYILAGLNPERVLLAAEAVGLGRAALNRATRYAKERVVFNRPIGKNQAIQHPLALNWMELEAANLMVFRAAQLYDAGKPCGAEANAAKYLAAEAGFKACTQAVMTHGGYGYSKEFHVERYMREVMIPRIAPVSREMILSFIAERVLGLPKSY